MKDVTEEVMLKALEGGDYPKPILLKDLGMMYATKKSRVKVRFGVYKCGFCGTEFKSNTYCIDKGYSKSCGCYRKRKSSISHKTHGLGYTRLCNVWGSIRDRTLNPKNKQYNDYGGRGITICDEWLDIHNFYNWAMSNGYEENKGLSIDRIDNDRNYEPSNCRWVTSTIQNRNQRKRRDNTSGYKGVSYFKRAGNYQAYIVIKSKKIHLGQFLTAIEGAITYNNYIIENNLEGFILNEIPEVQKW